jgi:hypothetical protein
MLGTGTGFLGLNGSGERRTRGTGIGEDEGLAKRRTFGYGDSEDSSILACFWRFSGVGGKPIPFRMTERVGLVELELIVEVARSLLECCRAVSTS